MKRLLIISLAVSLNVQAEEPFSTYSFKEYGSSGWGGSSNFWTHRYWNPAKSRDECRFDGCRFNTATHTGMDYSVNNPDYKDAVMSYGFGKVMGKKKDSYGQVSIRNLIRSGEYFQVNLLHSSDLSEAIAERDYIAKGQYVGKKGGIGAGGVTVFSPHLHVEIADTVSLAWIYTTYARPGELAADISLYSKASLTAHYSTTDANLRYYDPLVFVANKRELLPFVGRSSTTSESDFDVYGVTKKALYGFLPIQGNHKRSSILVRKTGKRSEAEDSTKSSGLTEKQKFLGNTVGAVPSSGISGVASDGYDVGDYMFLPFLDPTDSSDSRYGYPLKFSIVNDGDIIVDNDQLNTKNGVSVGSFFDGTKPSNSSAGKVPGYYLTAYLFKGRSEAFAQWKPGTAAKYKIYVHIPERGPIAKSVYYKIKPDGSKVLISKPVDQKNNGNKWVQLVAEDNTDVFDFNSLGYVGLSLGAASDDRNKGITISEDVAVDAVKFEKISTNNTNGINVTSNPIDAMYAKYQGYFGFKSGGNYACFTSYLCQNFGGGKIIAMFVSTRELYWYDGSKWSYFGYVS
ncbi:hypothetical protein [Undibacterium sp. Tian12W]|uniref:hypothetical protein n=1 Tax=Undibacterium sp. Tian12W TaxID=3413054 RepID=UPI003BF3485A